MKQLPDYSDWLTPERLDREEELWKESFNVKHLALVVQSLLDDFGLQDIIEFGCSTGHIPSLINAPFDGFQYLGIDKNPDCIQRAREKNQSLDGRLFQCSDIRDVELGGKRDIVIAHAFFKHFGLHERDEIMKQVLAHGRYAVFSIPVTEEDSFDDGTEFHHTWINDQLLGDILFDAGHAELFIPEFWPRTSLPERRVFVTREI